MSNLLKEYIISLLNEKDKNEVSESLLFHIKENIPLSENIFRPGSESFFDLFSEARDLYERKMIELNNDEDIRMLENDIGYWGEYEGYYVPLDYPMIINQIPDVYMPLISECDDFILEGKKKKYKRKIKKRKSKSKKDNKKQKLNKPIRNPENNSAYRVFVLDPKTQKVKKIDYGSPNMSRPWNDKERNASFVARHGCGTEKANDKTSARYWSCRAPRDFSKGKNVPKFW
tara:strand:- start:627 stop:1316 length:690 start_codon:yes stop_codon:yes gene_type:complete